MHAIYWQANCKSAGKKTNYRPPIKMEYGSRQRLRPWLEGIIEEGKIKGLRWLNAERSLFRVPWKHGGKQDWNKEDGQIFKEWAIHTGRYREGMDDEDFATWKTRLRCAFNKASDIQEEKDKKCPEDSEPHRVYRLRPRTECSQRQYREISRGYGGGSSPSESSQNSEEDMETEPSPPCPELEVPITVEGMQSESESLPSDLKNLSDLLGDCKEEVVLLDGQILELSPDYSNQDPTNGVLANYSNQNVQEDFQPFPTNKLNGAPVLDPQQTISDIADSQVAPQVDGTSTVFNSTTPPEDHEMILQLNYRRQDVGANSITNPKGSILYHNMPNNGRELLQGSPIGNTLFGPDNLDEIPFPSCRNIALEKQKKFTQELLVCLDRGVIFECDNGDIFATRLCKCVVYYGSPVTKYQAIKLVRNEKTKIFDFSEFVTTLKAYYSFGAECKMETPRADVILGFGQKWSLSTPYSEILIWGSLKNSKAYYLLKQIAGEGPGCSLEPSFEISNSNSLDKCIRNMTCAMPGMASE